MSLRDLTIRKIAHDAAAVAMPAVRLAPVLPAWAPLAVTCARTLRESRGPQPDQPSALERVLAVVGAVAGLGRRR